MLFEHAHASLECMPNISHLAYYEHAINQAQNKGTIRLIRTNNLDPDPGENVKTVVADGIYGDNEANRNLFLDGSGDWDIEVNGLVVALYFNAHGNGAQVAGRWVLRAGDVIHWTGNGLVERGCGAYHMYGKQAELFYG